MTDNLELGGTGRAYVLDLRAKRQARKDAQEAEKASLKRLQDFLGHYGTGSYNGTIIVQRTTFPQRRFDTKAFAEAYPELYEEFRTETSTSRVDIADGEV